MSLIDEPKAWRSSALAQELKVYTGELILGKDYDVVELTEVSSIIHDYTYSLNGATVITIRITYTNSSDKIVQRLEVI